MFLFAVGERAQTVTQHSPGSPVEISKMMKETGVEQYDRYVVSLDRQYISVGESAGGMPNCQPDFPCTATVYHYNTRTRRWDVFHGKKSFNSIEQIAEYMNVLHHRE